MRSARVIGVVAFLQRRHLRPLAEHALVRFRRRRRCRALHCARRWCWRGASSQRDGSTKGLAAARGRKAPAPVDASMATLRERTTSPDDVDLRNQQQAECTVSRKRVRTGAVPRAKEDAVRPVSHEGRRVVGGDGQAISSAPPDSKPAVPGAGNSRGKREQGTAQTPDRLGVMRRRADVVPAGTLLRWVMAFNKRAVIHTDALSCRA